MRFTFVSHLIPQYHNTRPLAEEPKAKTTSMRNEWGYELQLKAESSQFSVLAPNPETVFVVNT